MMLYLAMICGALAILETIVTAASFEQSKFRSETSLSRDADTTAYSHFRLQNTEESAVLAMINAFPRLRFLPSTFHAIRILCVAV
jgi:hypothetical protein